MPSRAGGRGPGIAALLLLPALTTAGTGAAQEQETILGTPSGIERESAELVRIEAGARLRETPDARSPSLVVFDTPTDVMLLERQGDWLLVRHGAWRGWINPLEASAARRPAPQAPPPAPGPRSGPDPRLQRRLESAARLLDIAPEPVAFGTFRLLTDVEDPKLLDRLRGAATAVSTSYRTRFGLDPGDGPHGDVVLFRHERDYREYEGEDPDLVSMGVRGHSFGGLAAVFVSPRNPDETVSVLVHELTHLLNRRALGATLPPWLEEGTANDLSFARIDRAGGIELGSLGGGIDIVQTPVRTRRGSGNHYSFTISGATAALTRLAAAQKRQQAPTLATLTDLTPQEFFDLDSREIHYSTSTFAVRFLLDGEGGDLAGPFRDYLARKAQGAPTDPEALRQDLELGWNELQRRFEAWVRKRAATLRL